MASETSILPSGAGTPFTSGATSAWSMSSAVAVTSPTAIRSVLTASVMPTAPPQFKQPSAGFNVTAAFTTDEFTPWVAVTAISLAPGTSVIVALQEVPVTLAGMGVPLLTVTSTVDPVSFTPSMGRFVLFVIEGIWLSVRAIAEAALPNASLAGILARTSGAAIFGSRLGI